MEIEHDKLLETITVRVPAVTKHHIDKLSPADKKKLQKEILIAIAHTIHEAHFDPSLYLREE